MERIKLTDIDWRLLSDQQYSWLHQNKECFKSGNHSPEHQSLPYFVPIFPSGNQPTLLKLLVESIYRCAFAQYTARRGIVAVEDHRLWEEGDIRSYFSTKDYDKSAYSPLAFSWEPLERDVGGGPPEILKAHATGYRRGQQEIGEKDTSFQVVKIRRVEVCTENLDPFKIEKAWQTMEEGRVVTCCATSAQIHFLSSESVIEVRGVNPEIDGLHVVDEVFHEGYDLAYSAICFFGCELVGDRVDNDIYLICDWTGVHNKSSSWAAQLWRVANKGLYHVRLVLGEDRSAGYYPEIAQRINPYTNSYPVLNRASSGCYPLENSTHSCGQITCNLSVPTGVQRMCTIPQMGAPEQNVISEAGQEEWTAGQHVLTKLPEAGNFSSFVDQQRAASDSSALAKKESSCTKKNDSHPRPVAAAASPRKTMDAEDLHSVAKSDIDDNISISPKSPTTWSRMTSSIPIVKEISGHTLVSRSRVNSPDDSSINACSSQSIRAQAKPMIEVHQRTHFEDIWNMSHTSKAGSIRSQSRSAPTNASDSKSTFRSGLGVKSSGILDDTVRPKSPRVSDSENSPRGLQSSKKPSSTFSQIDQVCLTDGNKGCGRETSHICPKGLVRNQSTEETDGALHYQTGGHFQEEFASRHIEVSHTSAVGECLSKNGKMQIQTPSCIAEAPRKVLKVESSLESHVDSDSSVRHPLMARKAPEKVLPIANESPKGPGFPGYEKALEHKGGVPTVHDAMVPGISIEGTDISMQYHTQTSTENGSASYQCVPTMGTADNQLVQKVLPENILQAKENRFWPNGVPRNHKVVAEKSDSKLDEEQHQQDLSSLQKIIPINDAPSRSLGLSVKIPVPVSGQALKEARMDVSVPASNSPGLHGQPTALNLLVSSPIPVADVVLPIPVLQASSKTSVPVTTCIQIGSENLGRAQSVHEVQSSIGRLPPPVIQGGRVREASIPEATQNEASVQSFRKLVDAEQSGKEEPKIDMQKSGLALQTPRLPVPSTKSKRPSGNSSTEGIIMEPSSPSDRVREESSPGSIFSFQKAASETKDTVHDIHPLGSMALGIDEAINGKEQLAGLATGETMLVAGALQTVCPEDIDLSGLSNPTCSSEQMQLAAIMFRGRIEQICHQIVQTILSISSTSNSPGLCASQMLIDKVGRALPSCIMQRGNYLYVVPRKLTPYIKEMFASLNIPPIFIGGVVTHLFSGIDSVYKSVRVNLLTNQLEAAPLHLYQDLGMEAIMRMDKPLLAPKLEHDADGLLRGKMYPGTSTLDFKACNQVEDATLGPKDTIEPRAQDASLLSGGQLDSYRNNADALQSRSVSALNRSNSGSQPLSSLKLAGGVRSESPILEPETNSIFDGFDVTLLKDKSNQEIATIVVDRLSKNNDLMIQFMVHSIEDCGQDVFLDRFLSLKHSQSDRQDSTLRPAAALQPLLQTSEGHGTHYVGHSSPPSVLPAPPGMRIKTALLPNLGGSLGLDQGLNLGSNICAPPASSMGSPSFKLDSILAPDLGIKNAPPALSSVQDLQNICSNSVGPSQLSTEAIQSLLQSSTKMPKVLQSQFTQPKFMDKIKDYIQGQKSSGPLRKYQEECVQKAEGGGNFIFVAPTGSGKTKIFVECSRRLLIRNPTSKIVVICPTVPLTSQQAACFVVEGFTDNVNAYSGENPLPPALWQTVLQQYNVMVMTPQILCSILDEKKGSFHQIDLLVLDEIHHCRGDHPYSKLMEHYKQTPKNKKRSQVLGFTASPAKSSTMEQACADLQQLMEKTDSLCVVINEDNEEVQKYVPSAEEETLYIEKESRLWNIFLPKRS